MSNVVNFNMIVDINQLLKEKGIEVGLHYPICLPNTEAFSNKPYVVESKTPNAKAWESEILSLPMGEHLSDEEVKWVIEGTIEIEEIKFKRKEDK